MAFIEKKSPFFNDGKGGGVSSMSRELSRPPLQCQGADRIFILSRMERLIGSTCVVF